MSRTRCHPDHRRRRCCAVRWTPGSRTSTPPALSSQGAEEELVGRVLAHRRGEFFLASTCGRAPALVRKRDISEGLRPTMSEMTSSTCESTTSLETMVQHREHVDDLGVGQGGGRLIEDEDARVSGHRSGKGKHRPLDRRVVRPDRAERDVLVERSESGARTAPSPLISVTCPPFSPRSAWISPERTDNRDPLRAGRPSRALDEADRLQGCRFPGGHATGSGTLLHRMMTLGWVPLRCIRNALAASSRSKMAVVNSSTWRWGRTARARGNA